MDVSTNTSVADEPGVFVDPLDANFVIDYNKFDGNRIYIDSLFTASINPPLIDPNNAIANASPNNVDELGGSVNSLNYDGRSRLVVVDAGAIVRPILTWGRCIQAIGQQMGNIRCKVK